jgi:hypothetical protein
VILLNVSQLRHVLAPEFGMFALLVEFIERRGVFYVIKQHKAVGCVACGWSRACRRSLRGRPPPPPNWLDAHPDLVQRYSILLEKLLGGAMALVVAWAIGPPWVCTAPIIGASGLARRC